MIRTKYNNWFGTVRIVGDRFGDVLVEEERLEIEGYERYHFRVSYITGNFIVKMCKNKGQLEKRLDQERSTW